MGSAIAARAPDAAIENMLRLVAAFSGHAGPLTIDVGNVATTECTDASGANLEGLATACSAIASASPMAAQLLGEEAAEKAKVRLPLATPHSLNDQRRISSLFPHLY